MEEGVAGGKRDRKKKDKQKSKSRIICFILCLPLIGRIISFNSFKSIPSLIYFHITFFYSFFLHHSPSNYV